MKTMKNKTSLFFVLIISLLTSCKSALVDFAFEKKGIYDGKVKIEKITNNEKQIVFIPMHHVGRLQFYDDVKIKVDSLQNIGYIVYYEKIKKNNTDTISKYKFRKLLNFPLPENGYMDLLDLSKMKLKYEVINQPSYELLNVNSKNSINADMSIEEIITTYEKTNGKIILEDCDFKSKYNEKYKCNSKYLDENKRREVMIEYRNEKLVNYIKESKNNKIIIIYGREHLIGVKEKLKNIGYLEN